MATELVEIRIVKATIGKVPGQVLFVPSGTAEMWIHQGRAKRVERMVPPVAVEATLVESAPVGRRKRTTTA